MLNKINNLYVRICVFFKKHAKILKSFTYQFVENVGVL